jgi:AraC family transcriptional regulator
VSDPSRRREYAARLNRVLDHIDAHLGEELRLEELARVACFSKYHFHRLFRTLLGENLGQYIQRLRLERAASTLLQEPDQPVTRIAGDSGFGSAAAFTRSFRAHFRCSPSAYRRRTAAPASKAGKTPRNPGIAAGNPGNALPSDSVHIEYHPNAEVWRIDMEATSQKRTVEVREQPAMTVAYVRHVGPYKGDPKLFERLFGRLFRWAGPRNLIRPPDTRTLIIYHDNPEITAGEKLRVSVCITVPPGTAGEGEVGILEIPAGKYAITRFQLGQDEFQQAWDWVYGAWLPESGYAPDDRPCFEMYPEERRPDGTFTVDIYAPVRPL